MSDVIIHEIESGETFKPTPGDMFSGESVDKLISTSMDSLTSEMKEKTLGNILVPLNSYRVYVKSCKGIHHMRNEDSFAVIEDLNGYLRLKKFPLQSIYGVFDGHGGFVISEYLSVHLLHAIAGRLVMAETPMEAFHDACTEVDQFILSKMKHEVRGRWFVTSFV